MLIRIHATTVTSGDVIKRKLRGPLRMVHGLAFGLKKNAFLGHELAGEIEAAGAQATRFKPGDPVFASTGNKGGRTPSTPACPKMGCWR